MAMTAKIVFFIILSLIGLTGAAANGFHLLQDFYIRPLLRFVGYSSLLAYSLLMLRRSRYNIRL